MRKPMRTSKKQREREMLRDHFTELDRGTGCLWLVMVTLSGATFLVVMSYGG